MTLSRVEERDSGPYAEYTHLLMSGPSVDLSTADSNKWLTLLKARLEGQRLGNSMTSDYQLLGSIRQRQRRLTAAQVVKMVERYREGATVYELSTEFGCHRTTVSARLKKEGVSLRLQPPASDAIDLMAKLYASGLSSAEIGERLGYCANTVRNGLQGKGMGLRDTHGRER
jgi:lambda repressor-like predicted transcriptional regulator